MSNSKSCILILLIALLSCSANYPGNESAVGYNFKKPDAAHVLPEILNEISGLTWLDSTTFACVQDEKGIMFIYDVINNKINNQYTFNIDGDYEGITRVGNTIYILRSDGVLFEIADYHSREFKLKTYVTGIPANNNEGLCYDADNKRLLIACKSKIGKGREFKDKRAIYGFDLQSKKLSRDPVYNFDVQEIKKFAEAHKISMPTQSKKNGQVTEPVIKFATSAVCIHPFTKKLYLLSASDHLLFVFNAAGDIEHIELLNPVMFNKAEGITFFENGDMLITNEAQDKKPTVFRFNYKG